LVVLVLGVVPVPVPAPPVDAPPPPADAPPVDGVELGVEGVTGVVAPLPAALLLLLDDELWVEDGVVVEDGVELDASAAVVDVLSVDVAAAPPIDVLAGATSACGFVGTTSCVTLLPPQAESPPVARSIRATAVARRRMTGWR
jgi:hypothetical protein